MSQAEHDRRIDYIEFPADDIEEAKRFYAAVFGWEFTDYGPTYTSFQDGRLSGGFTTEATVSKGGPLVVIYATDLEAISAKVIEHGGEVIKEPFEFPGGRRFHFEDPNGNDSPSGPNNGQASESRRSQTRERLTIARQQLRCHR